jgi:hypothetical protein
MLILRLNFMYSVSNNLQGVVYNIDLNYKNCKMKCNELDLIQKTNVH